MSHNNRMWKRPVGLALLALLIYGNSLGNDFCYDDRAAIPDNEALNLPVAQLFWSPYLVPGLWRPVMTIIHAGLRAMAGPNPLWFHVINLLAHAAVVVLLYQLLLVLPGRPRVAL